MRIGYICQYFLPEVGAPSARGSELTREWARAGHDVTVITGLPNHPTGIVPPEYRDTLFRREQLDGVHVWRNWLFATPNEGFVKKTLGHLSFMVSVALFTLPRARNFDVLIVSSPTFFVVITTWLMSAIWRIPYVFEVRDLWPGIFVELGVLKQRWIIRLLESVEMFLYHRAARVVVVTDSFREILIKRGLHPGKVVTITNGVDTDFYHPGVDGRRLRTEHQLSGKFVVLYIGAHGISHALAAILAAARLLQDDAEVEFLFVGEGAEKARLVALAHEMGLRNVRFLPAQPKHSMPEWYAAADAVLVPLRNIPLFDAFIPSKMFEILGVGRPIVASVRGEPGRILEASGGALVVEPEDAAAIAGAIRRIKSDPALRAALSARGRQFVVSHYRRATLAVAYAQMLADVVRGVRPQ